MPYFPKHTFVIGLTTIRRERRLPPFAFGEVLVKQGTRVEAADPVLTGTVPGDFLILDALAPLGLRSADQFTQDMLEILPGERVEQGQVIAAQGQGRGMKVVKSPADAVIARAEGGQIILQTNPRPVEIKAMCPGEVTSVRGSSEILLESIGALIQCAWGNGKQAFGTYQTEPPEGIESLQEHTLLQRREATALVMTRPIPSAGIFSVALEQEITAIIAPSMHADLREAALRQTIPVILTEGFGEQKMSEIVYNLLRDNLGRPALIDAVEPERWSSNRPEIIIPLPSGGALPPAPEMDQPLTEGAFVRVTRAPWAGMAGRVRRLSDAPHAVENGLRLPGAEVELLSERTVFVPLANLELVGRSVDAPGTGGA